MGFFSYLTSDTQRSIPNIYSGIPTFTVYMITEDGQVFTENAYDGYGVFGGKDFFTLAAELNGLKGETEDKTRDRFFNEIWLRGVEKDGVRLTYREDFPDYMSPIYVKGIGNTNANDLVSKHGWEYWDNGGTSGRNSVESFAKNGFKMPKIVEALLCNPKNTIAWKTYWDSLPYPKDCEFQGYFYDTDFDDDI